MTVGAGSPARRQARRLVAGLVALVVLWGGVSLLVSAFNRSRALHAAFPRVEGRLSLPGLRAPARVLRDPRGVPHVVAASEHDAYLALGLVHAQDRLDQMDWLRRSARGRLAERVGAGALAADREARLLGIGRHAEESVADLSPRSRELLDAYAEGVNAWIDRIRAGEAAPPVALADLPVEPWSAADSVALVKLYAWSLVRTLEGAVLLQDLIEQLGGFGARPFFPPGVGLETIPDPGRSAWRRPRPAGPLAGLLPAPPPDDLPAWAGLVGRSLGSSAFVIGGRHTASRSPILVADSHLPPRAPVLFHQAHLRWKGGEVAGAAIPGLPLFWIGHNGRVAWAAVNAGAVVVDVFVETLHPTAPRYHDGRGWRELEEHRETIAVRGDEDEELVVRETRHGPLVNGLLGEDREPLAIAWSGARRGDPVSAFLGLPRAEDAAALRAALARHREPVVSVVYADRKGAAGLQLAGWLPSRSLPTGLVPVPGRNRWYSWKEGIPFAALPHLELADGRGFVVAADARLGTSEEAGVIEWLWRTGTRYRRLREVLAGALAEGSVDLRSAVQFQQDVASPDHRLVIDEALRRAGPLAGLGGEERWVAEQLRSWDGRSTPESVGATVYHVFLKRLLDGLLESALGRDLARRYLSLDHVDPVHLAVRLLRPDGPNAPGPPDADAIQRILRDTWIWLSVELGPNRDRWTWGRLHLVQFRPLWSGRGWDHLGPFPVQGDGATVFAAEFDPADPFDVRLASLFRLGVDLERPHEVLTSLAPGESGHPGHPHSTDGVDDWRAGRPRLLATSPLLVEEMAAAELDLEPGP